MIESVFEGATPPDEEDADRTECDLASRVLGLSELPAGPVLGSALAALDPDRAALNGYLLIEVLAAQARQIAHDQARLLAGMVEVGHSGPGDPAAAPQRRDEIDPSTAGEIGFALGWTRRASERTLALAVAVVERLPVVHQAMLAGRVDQPRAKVIAEETAVLSDAEARQVAVEAVAYAEGRTTGQLGAWLRRRVLSIDPQAAAERRRRSERGRRLVGQPDPAGTATLAGYQLPAEQAMAAQARISDLARMALRAGDTRTLDEARADVFLDLLLGRPLAGGAEEAPNQGRSGGVHLQIDLPTLMGLAEHPGEIPGWGPVLADAARAVAARLADDGAPWTISVRDANGSLVHHGPVRRHPTAEQIHFVQARDRTCRAPGCQAPARQADVDHTRDWQHGGATTTDNLGLLCRHHHRLKHHPGWKLRQPRSGVFVWTSRLGHQYLVTPDPPELRDQR